MPTYPLAAVAADHPLASQAGAAILKAGGNAIDAAVATSFALSVVRPYSCGVGGGGFLLVHGPCTRGQHGVVLDYRETAPASIRSDSFEHDSDPHASTRSGKSVGVPGTVAGLLEALDRFGSLTRAQVLAPAIALAEAGFLADAHYVTSARDIMTWMRADGPDLLAQRIRRFGFVWERLLRQGHVREGDCIRLPEQADLFRRIARDGRDAMYAGEVARAIVDAVHQDGGELSLDDLSAYGVRTREPFVTGFRNARVLSMPPPSSGGLVLAQVLRLLELREHDLRDAIARGHNNSAYVHLVCECLKHAFADRARWLSDCDFVPVPTEHMLDPARLQDAADRIDPRCTRPQDSYGIAPPPQDGGGTSHVSVVDAQGNAVACTETINLEFGSLVAVPSFGFCLNDTLDDFAVRAGKPNAFGLVQASRNAPAPGKRPLSAMTPTIVLDEKGQTMLVVGASGGPRIITATLQTLLNAMLFGMDATHSVSAQRFHHQWSPHTLQLETDLLEQPVAHQLRALGHDVSKRAPIGTVQCIRRIDAGWDAASDPRKGGAPAGM